MKWFKHYSDASRSEKLATLRAKYGLEGYARYWLLVELLAERFDGKDTSFNVHHSTIKHTLGIHHNNMVHTLLLMMSNVGLMSASCKDNIWLIKMPKLLEIKDNHTKNLQVTGKKITPRIDKNRIDKKRVVKKEKILKDSFSDNLVGLFDDDEIIAWLKSTGTKKIQEELFFNYDASFLKDEVTNAFFWKKENKKTRKAGLYLKTWCERSNKPGKASQRLKDELDKKLLELIGGE